MNILETQNKKRRCDFHDMLIELLKTQFHIEENKQMTYELIFSFRKVFTVVRLLEMMKKNKIINIAMYSFSVLSNSVISCTIPKTQNSSNHKRLSPPLTTEGIVKTAQKPINFAKERPETTT